MNEHPEVSRSRPVSIPRFSLVERLSHWIYALFFLAAFVTGLLMWLPATSGWLVGIRHAFSHAHAGMGFLMVLLPLLLFLLFDRTRLRAGLREIDRWDDDDRRWFWAALRGGTLRGAAMPPQRRFNAGQKASAVLVAAMATGFVITGSMLLLRLHLPAWLVSRALWLHGFLAVAAVALFLGHLAHVFLTRHGRDYLQAMVRGTLPLETARARHSKWPPVVALSAGEDAEPRGEAPAAQGCAGGGDP